MQSMYDRLLSDACKIGWSFTSILQIGIEGTAPSSLRPKRRVILFYYIPLFLCNPQLKDLPSVYV
jgi:hypothetical protein